MVKVLEVRLSPYADDIIVRYRPKRGEKTKFRSEVIVVTRDRERLARTRQVDLMKSITWNDWKSLQGYEEWYKFGRNLLGKIEKIILRINEEEITFTPRVGDETWFDVEGVMP